ncbi:MAG: nicotinate (nicotinamide) nucleotide adenylyltransferase [Myxococcota bacterium]
MTESRTIAVFGGSFDPPHVGHVLAMAYVLAVEAVDGLVMVPTFAHPFGKEPSAGFDHRVRMCELCAEPLRQVEVSRIEEELGGTSHTLRTLEAMTERHPETQLRLVVGADVLPETAKWHRWDRIAQVAPPIVVGRAGYGGPDGPTVAMPDVSSTELRRRLARDRTTRGMLPAAVERHILDHDLYRTEEGEGA